ncbi:MAG: bleomycin resistance protein, partial [Actinomycetota bacterium]
GGDPGPTYYFRVADIARSADRVRELGGTAGETVDSEAGRSLIGNTDPSGVPFELWQPADGF